MTKLNTEKVRVKRLSDLTPDEKRIIVAEFDGKRCSICNNTGYLPKWSHEDYQRIKDCGCQVPDKQPRIPCREVCKLPDYPNDQNAIIAACGKLDVGDRADFTLKLKAIVKADTGWIHKDGWLLANATASQRTDALILCIGKAEL